MKIELSQEQKRVLSVAIHERMNNLEHLLKYLSQDEFLKNAYLKDYEILNKIKNNL